MDGEYPLMLYRDGASFSWDGRPTDSRVVADGDEHKAAEADGWKVAADYLSVSVAEKSLLDGNAKEIDAALPALSLEELEALRDAEKAGKTRKGVLAAIDAAIDAKLA